MADDKKKNQPGKDKEDSRRDSGKIDKRIEDGSKHVDVVKKGIPDRDTGQPDDENDRKDG